MNIKVAYFSRTKHSEKIAEALAEALHVEARNLAKNPTFTSVDLLFLVGGIYEGESSKEMLEWVKKVKPINVQRVALITNCVTMKYTQKAVAMALRDNYIEMQGEVVVQGRFLLAGMGHPKDDDIDQVITFAKTVIDKLTAELPEA